MGITLRAFSLGARTTPLPSHLGVHSYGTCAYPTSSSTGLGAWHATCSGGGKGVIAPLTSSQNGFVTFPSVSPWMKSNAPGPSVVPAANE
jgi:hypothetical protein